MNKHCRTYEFDEGLTVTELKRIIQDWPEVDDNGDPTEVWFETGDQTSSIVLTMSWLNSGDVVFGNDLLW
jgi:hypothetical protein